MILLTGYRGFIGREILEILNLHKLEFQVFDGDITNLNDVERYSHSYDTIIHLASIITKKNKTSKEEIHNINIIGTQNLLKKFQNSHFVYISTTDVERDILSDYAASKLKAEKEVLNTSKNNLVIRLPSIFGANTKQKKLIPLLLDKYLLKLEFELSNNEISEQMYVKECAELIINNLNKKGIIRFKGTKISNQDLEEIVKSVVYSTQINQNIHHLKLYNNLTDMVKEINK
jgi:dTDP-4-dehydrorhamnose reductase